MRPSLVLSCALLLAACSFKPSGEGGGDDDASIDGIPIDACIPATETCEGTDEDCDGMIDEGFTSGAPCDGPDGDVCLDDMTVCNAQGQEVCGNTSGDDDAELCNQLDDDCDGDMDEGFTVGAQCDGADTDMCPEAQFTCNQGGTAVECLDTGDNDVEICNMADEDCDGVDDNGFDLQGDEMNCGSCGTVCQQINSTNTCTTGNCVPACNLGFANCDTNANNGCELTNTDPQCSNGAAVDIEIVADNDSSPQGTAMLQDDTERLVRVRLRETLSADVPITARFTLTSGSGTDYDLFVYCPNCQASPISDGDDTIEVGRTDIPNNDRQFDVWVEVRLDLGAQQTTCAMWTLVVTGDVATTNRCAD